MGDHLYRLAIAKNCMQWRGAAVDASCGTVIANLSMYPVGKIDDCGAAWQGHYLPLGGKDVDLIGEQINLYALQEFEGVPRTLLHL